MGSGHTKSLNQQQAYISHESNVLIAPIAFTLQFALNICATFIFAIQKWFDISEVATRITATLLKFISCSILM